MLNMPEGASRPAASYGRFTPYIAMPEPAPATWAYDLHRCAHRRRTMSRCQRKIVPGVTISRIAARRSADTVPASSPSHARSGHVKRE